MAGTGAGPWTVANLLTGVRIVIVPVFAWATVQAADDDVGWRLFSTALFALAILTDRLDGDLARSRNEVTPLGQILDPIADKLLIGTALVLLSVQDRIPWWVTVVILVREVGITAWRLVVVRRVVIPASPGGKAKAVVQFVAIGLMLFPLTHLPVQISSLATMLLYVAVVVTTVTGIDYVRRGLAAQRVTAGRPA